MITFQDAVNHLLDYLGSDPGDAALRDARKAVNEAYRDLANAHSWTYLYTPACLQTAPMIGADPTTGLPDGTAITYQQEDGQLPRMITLHGATWPSWAVDGMIVLGSPAATDDGVAASASLVYLVDRVVGPNVLQLREDSNPGADIVTPMSYRFLRDSYPLPKNFTTSDIVFIPSHFPNLQFVHPREWLRISQNEVRVGMPKYYSVLGYEREPGRHSVHFAPIPDIQYELHYSYKRLPRPARLFAQSAGTISVDADLRTVSGLQGATFTPAMEGNSIVRFAAQGSTTLPTDEYRDSPYDHEALVTQYLDQTHCLIDPPAHVAYQGVLFTISDMLDIDFGAMETVLLRLCEQKLSTIRILKDRQFPREEYLVALDRAKAADSRSMMGRSPREYLFNRSVDHTLWRNR